MEGNRHEMNRRDFLRTTGLGTAGIAAWSIAQDATRGRLPNVVIIFTDDQGYEDLGCFGAPKIRTPNIDRMATEGMRLTDFYSAAPVCTPSRAALLTGCYPERVGGLGVLFPRNNTGLNPGETTIAKMLKSRGYRTACIGKWHLGHLPEFLPTSHGFDSYFGIPYSNDMTIAAEMKVADGVVLREGVTRETMWQPKKNLVPLLRNEEVIEYPADQNLLTKRYTEEATAFIRGSGKQPFFLYLAHTMPHIPLYASPEFQGRSEAGLYGDCIEEIDWSTGRILDTLRDLGLDGDTLVVYTSDNGPWQLKGSEESKVKGNLNRRVGGSAHPLKGYKFSRWEGGVREPSVAWWPGRVPAGSVCGEIAGTIDLLPTIAEIAGAALPTLPIDGKSILPLLEGRPEAVTPHEALFYGNEGVRAGKWKFRKDELYDLATDVSETRNVAAENPAVVTRLSALLEAHRDNMRANRRPHGGEKKSALRPKASRVLPGWTATQGVWDTQKGALVQTQAQGETSVFAPKADWSDATVEVTARATDGKEGFRLMLGASDASTYIRWSTGAFGNTIHSLMKVVKGKVTKRSKSSKGAIKRGQSYRLRMETDGATVRCFIDGALVNEETFDTPVRGTIGLGSCNTAVEYRDVRVTGPDGTVLLEALRAPPTLPK